MVENIKTLEIKNLPTENKNCENPPSTRIVKISQSFFSLFGSLFLYQMVIFDRVYLNLIFIFFLYFTHLNGDK